MEIYIIVYAIIAFFALIETKKPDDYFHQSGTISINTRKSRFVLLGMTIIAIAGIRWEIGTDWDAFLYDFNFMRDSTWNEVESSIYGMTYGKGYVLLTYLFAKNIGNYSLYLAFQALIIILCAYPVIYKYSRYPAISFLGLFAYSFGYAIAVPRSGIALALCYQVFDVYLEKKYYKAALILLIATSFHNTAILFSAIFLLDRFKLNNKTVIVLVCMSVLLSLFAKPLLLRIASLPFVPISYSMRINVYFIQDTDFGGVGGLIRLLTRGFVVVLIFVYLWKRRDDRTINLLVNMYLISTAIYIAVSNISEVFMRLAYNFEDVSQFIIFGECIASANGKERKKILRIILIVFFATKMLSRLVGNELMVPYKTIFGQQ